MPIEKSRSKKIIEIGQTADGQNATVEFHVVTDSFGNVTVDNLMINKFDINKAEKDRIAQNEALLKKLTSDDLVQARILEIKPVDNMTLADTKALNQELQEAGLSVVSIHYTCPKVGRTAYDVEFKFMDEFNESYTKKIDITFGMEKDEYHVSEFSKEDIRINPNFLHASPMALSDNDPSAWVINENITNAITVRSFKMKPQHTTNTPTVMLTVQARKTGKVNIGGSKYFTKTITFPTEEFAFTDAEWIFKEVSNLEHLKVKTLSPPKYIKDFEIDFKPIANLGAKVHDFSVVEGAKYDKDARIMTIILRVSVFGVEEQFTKTIQFEKSYNEALLETATEADIIISGIEHFISTDNPLFNENALVNAFDVTSPEIEVVFVDGSLVKYSNDKRMFSGKLNLIAGESYTDITFTSSLGLGLIPPKTTGIFANLNANIPSEIMQKFAKINQN